MAHRGHEGRVLSMKFLNTFQALPDKDRQRLLVLASVFLSLMLWTWNLAPALKTLREVPLQLSQLDAQTQQLKAMQAQAQTLQKSPRIKSNEAASLLQNAASEVLGNGARLNIEGTRATLTLSGVSADSLAQFVALARTQSQTMPIEAHLQKFSASGSASKDSKELWRGALILSLPGG
jgi:general secretion pathway protein M